MPQPPPSKGVPAAPPRASAAPGKQGTRKQPRLLAENRRRSRDVIYEAMMRGGEAFGRPFVAGVSTLTERIVQHLKQRGFFLFETLDAKPAKSKNVDDGVNKFTRYGAAPYTGELRRKPDEE